MLAALLRSGRIAVSSAAWGEGDRDARLCLNGASHEPSPRGRYPAHYAGLRHAILGSGEVTWLAGQEAEKVPLPSRTMARMQLLSVNTARAEHFIATNGESLSSAIRKRARDGRIAVGPLGLAGDEQADLSVHGGLAKAVYAYPQEHYAIWATMRSQAGVDGALQPGDLGENLTITGLLEGQAFIGDVLRFPDCELVVSEPRYPCFKLAAHVGFKHAVKMMAQSGYCGFYLAVKREGSIAAGEHFELIPGLREVGIAELFRSKMRKKL